MSLRRRELLAVLGGATFANLLPAHGQQAVRVYRVGSVASASPLFELVSENPISPQTKAFLRGMRDLGYIEGKNLTIERRSAEGKFERLPEILPS